jgi:hypothetical protein
MNKMPDGRDGVKVGLEILSLETELDLQLFSSNSSTPVDASGMALGSLRATKTSVTSFDAQGRQGFSLPFKDTQWTVLFPSIDLFER